MCFIRIYFVTEINHSISPGEFKTSAKLMFTDAYGVHEGFMNVLNKAILSLDESNK